MALENCKECNAQISKKAKTCPSCGSPQVRTSSSTKLIAGFIIFSVVVGIFQSCAQKNRVDQAAEMESARLLSLTPAEREIEEKLKSEAAKKVEDEKALTGAIYACKELIQRRMKDPSSVSFLLSTSETPVRKNKKGNYEVLTKVRAKNSFGAYNVSAFKCTVSLNNQNWMLIDLKES